jgi:uncharacterized protein (DUF1015 family)
MGLMFNLGKIQDFGSVIAPPYDVISEEEKKRLKNSNPYNIVNLTLPDEASDSDKYNSASRILSLWIEQGILEPEKKECFYVLEESFIEDGVNRSFTGFAGILKIEDYGNKNGVLRHEKTLSKPREDRLNLLKSCRANLEFIYTLFSDSDRSIGSIIESVKRGTPEISTGASYDETLHFKLWKITEEPAVSKITELMKNKTLLIADGHHRYETSRLYREDLKKSNNGPNGTRPEDYIMSLFVSSSQDNIIIHPTHRIINFKEKVNLEHIIEKLGVFFSIEKIVSDEKEIAGKMRRFSEKSLKAVCIIDGNGNCCTAVLKHDLNECYKKTGLPMEGFDPEFEQLDVNILHKLILSGILRDFPVTETSFCHTIGEIITGLQKLSAGEESEGNLHGSSYGFILNAPDIKTVEGLSQKGLIMPQKSTYFYPKPCSGLIIYKF